MKQKSRGLFGYVIIIGAFLLVAVLMSNSAMNQVSRRIEYPELLRMIENGEVGRVAIRSNYLVGLKKSTEVSAADFPDRRFDFETTIGTDFIETALTIKARKLTESTGEKVSPEDLTVSDLDFTVEYRAPVVTPWYIEFLPLLITLVLIIAFWMLIMRQQNGGSSRMMNFSRSHAQIVDKEKNKITFADVAGAKEEKEELQEMVDFLKNPKRFSDAGARIPKGVLLVGPPGTGKTLLARAVAGEAGVPFLSISGSDFVEMFVGVGASRVRDLFEQARKMAPSIIFIDEIDAVGRHRGAGLGGGNDEREQTLNQILVGMDGFSKNEGVIVMAATNRKDILDPALMRPGRFDRQITVNYPDLEGRVAILRVHARGKVLGEDVDLENVAKRTPYATGADLENIMNEAAILAARSGQTVITQHMLTEAIARVQMGPEKKSHKVREDDKRMTAIHESGHAIVGHYIPGGDEVHLITVVPRGQSAGHTLSLPDAEKDNLSRSELMAKVCMTLGGHAAENVVLGEIYTGASSDLKYATELCRRMVTEFGMSEKIGTIYLSGEQEVFLGRDYTQTRSYSEAIAAEVDHEVRRMLAECYERTKAVISSHMPQMNALVDALVREDTVTRSEFLALMQQAETAVDEG